MRTSVVALLVPLFALAGCVSSEQLASVYAAQRAPTSEERSALAATLRTTLFDPYSVRDAAISNVMSPKSVISWSPSAKAICVRMNGKNRFGAYIGLQHSLYKYSESGALLGIDDTPIARQQCSDPRLGYSPFTEIENL